MKKLVKLAISAIAIAAIAGCGGSSAKRAIVAVPNDTTNEARALIILDQLGFISLKDGAGIQATVMDIVDKKNLDIREVEAAQLPNVLPDVDYAVINSNFAIAAGLNPMKDSLAMEGAYSAYANILAVKEGAENTPAIRALVAALGSRKVADFILGKYAGSVVSVVAEPGDGFDAGIDYAALDGTTVKVAASPTPHAEILAIAKDILAERGIKLEVVEFSDYVQPNMVVESGELDANYFQHKPYLDDFNKENRTHLVSAAAIHVEPMGVYGGRQKSFDILAK